MNFIQTLDSLLDWKKLPAYRAEPRVDFIVAGALPEIIKLKYKSEVKLIIPELPIRIGTIYSKLKTNKSYKVDFYVLLKNGKNIFIEFKTDSSSRRDQQDKYLIASENAGMGKIVQGIIDISSATTYKKKYKYLLNKLIENSLVSQNEHGYKEIVKNDKIDILFIQPHSNNKNEIGFEEIAELMVNSNDKLYKHFGNILGQIIKYV